MRTGVDHEENFPVASWLCPPRQRPAVVSLYRFARTADDIADEGPHPAAERLSQLALYRSCLIWAAEAESQRSNPAPAHWQGIFSSLRQHIGEWGWPTEPMHHLLDAFEQDVRHTASGHRYQSHAELLDYCTWSANPVGRLLLHLFAVQDSASLRQSDDICTALQLINFWQDISVDWPRKRHYLPQDALARHGLSLEDFEPGRPPSNSIDRRCSLLVSELFEDATQRMRRGAPLAWRLPGRFGWELRLVVLGGLRVAEKAAAAQHQTWRIRPKVTGSDGLRLLWRCLLAAPTDTLATRRP